MSLLTTVVSIFNISIDHNTIKDKKIKHMHFEKKTAKISRHQIFPIYGIFLVAYLKNSTNSKNREYIKIDYSFVVCICKWGRTVSSLRIHDFIQN